MKKIALVVGHSSRSKGAYNEDMNIHEYDLNKIEAQLTSDLLEKRGYDPYMIFRDTYATLPKKINELECDIIISFHHNSFSDKSANGTETLYYHRSQAGKVLASDIHRYIVSALGFKDRGIQPKTSEDDGGYLLKYTNAPCVILEPCFMSNNEELKEFLGKQARYINAVCDAIDEYFRLNEGE